VEKGRFLSCAGIPQSAQPFLVALLRFLCPTRQVVVVAEGVKVQERFHQDVQTWLRLAADESPRADQPSSLDLESLLFYPAWETLPHESKLPHVDVISERLETLVALSAWKTSQRESAARKPPVVVTNVIALLQRTFPPDQLRRRTRTLIRGERIDPLDLIEWLEDQGYEPEAQVNHHGEIALRGGIVDIFPLTSPWPVRLEFFGDELESLRYFDPISQISRENIESVTVPPGGELGLLKRWLPSEASPDALRRREGESADGIAETISKPSSLLEYLPPETLFIFCEPDTIEEQAMSYAELVPANDRLFISWENFQDALARTRIPVLALTETDSPRSEITDRESEPVELRFFQSLDAYRPIVERMPDPQIAETQRRQFFAQLHRCLRQGYAVHLFCNNDGERQRFEEIWAEYGLSRESRDERRETAATTEPSAFGFRLSTHLGTLSRGFISDGAKLVVVTDAEIFGRYKVQRPRRLKSPHAQTSRSLLDIDFTHLEAGDYVVHLEHGIGRYLGLERMPAGGGERGRTAAGVSTSPQQETQESLVIEYAPRDPDQPAPKLYVPISEAHLVSKYVGTGKARPPLNALGGGRWEKTKEHAAHAVRDLAAELLSIQAARASKAGHAFKPDAPWQREFESAFLFEETPDQMRAIIATKEDMEAPRPMDRLICGDVGYGKTEVAIRAAFKAIMDGRQVAVLVPTTVLAQQHFNTFRERIADYPVRVELLSRFRNQREQRKVIQDLATGAVDIVIGTHRLVQDDVAFKDLGLVVIDEEQRFGVLHKEKFKLLRKLVDVLTLSATPIPRTLYLALTGARDMSAIETPPQDRLPVETIVCQYDERVIRDAILRELNRGGQVFYLHNRVFDIDNVALRLRALVPKARVVVGHGQMHNDELEEVMTRFVNGEADVLLATTIIESGIDIPNANTIIIDRADRFGLSDLYQLRGRVGRYKHQAYAYLLVPRHARLLTDARKRISAIKQYSSLGSGFKIAMRDLEIRGAGNLLGPQQSGHITAVGFELYCQLLKQSIAALKGEKVKPRVEVQVRLDFLALNAAEEQEVRGQKSEIGHQESEVRNRTEEANVRVPRETATYSASSLTSDLRPLTSGCRRAFAHLPINYVPEPEQRIEIYRKLAEITDDEGVSRLKAELRDRFGPLPGAVELLLQVATLKVLASEHDVSVIESKDDKLMLTRNNDLITVSGKLPRLTKKEPRARLNKIKRLLQTLK
jgi:transcription-repair coupling factor (superfamily II helicase)